MVLSNQRQLVLVRACGRLLALDVLHYPAQVRSAACWEADLPPSAATDTERALASQLIALASGPVDWARYRDTRAEELAALLQAKIAQQPAAPAEEPVVLQLLDALQQSVAQVRQQETASVAAATRARKPRTRRKIG